MKKILIVSAAVAIVLTTLAAFGCTGEEGEVRELYAEHGYVAYECSASEFVSDGDVDFVYHGVAGANTSEPRSVFVITFSDLDSAFRFEELYGGDPDYPNLRRSGRAIVFGDKEAVELY